MYCMVSDAREVNGYMDGFHITSSLPCWMNLTKFFFIFVISSNIVKLFLALESLGIGWTPA